MVGTFDTDANTLEWTVTYSGLTTPPIGAHFHGPISYLGLIPDEDAPIQVGTPGDLTSPFHGVAKIDDTQAKDLKDGRWYFNLQLEVPGRGDPRPRRWQVRACLGSVFVSTHAATGGFDAGHQWSVLSAARAGVMNFSIGNLSLHGNRKWPIRAEVNTVPSSTICPKQHPVNGGPLPIEANDCVSALDWDPQPEWESMH